MQFSLDKLQWYNQQFIRRMSVEELARKAMPYLKKHGIEADEAYVQKVAALMQERITFVEELATFCRFFYEDPTTYEEKGVQKRWKENSAELVRAYADRLEQLEEFTAETAEQALRELAEERGVKAAEIIHPTRLAISGLSFGPSLFEMMEVIGKEACVRRLRRAAEVLLKRGSPWSRR
nr:hypothetical protein [Rhodothermus marinus]